MPKHGVTDEGGNLRRVGVTVWFDSNWTKQKIEDHFWNLMEPSDLLQPDIGVATDEEPTELEEFLDAIEEAVENWDTLGYNTCQDAALDLIKKRREA